MGQHLWHAKMTTALLDRLTHRCHILETANDSYRFIPLKNSLEEGRQAKACNIVLPPA